MTTYWDGSYPPSILFPPKPPTGATAGTPGTWTPSGSTAPSTLAEANALGLSLGAIWATGQYVLLANGTTHIHWNGTAFANGNAPAPIPTVVTVAPTNGPASGGTVVTLTGTAMTGSTGFTVGGVAVTAFTVLSATQVRGTTGAHAAGVVDVVLQHPAGNVTRATSFTYNAAPTLATVAPATGTVAGGEPVVLTGTGFTGATAATFGGSPGVGVTVVNATTINVTTPAHAAGVVDVVVGHPNGNATKTGGFTYA